MSTKSSEVLVGRRYLERGFLDAAMKLFVRNAPVVEPETYVKPAGSLSSIDSSTTAPVAALATSIV